jgi:hypothetical protein
MQLSPTGLGWAGRRHGMSTYHSSTGNGSEVNACSMARGLVLFVWHIHVVTVVTYSVQLVQGAMRTW